MNHKIRKLIPAISLMTAIAPFVVSAQVDAQMIIQLQAQIQALQAQIQAVQQMQGSTPPINVPTAPAGAPTSALSVSGSFTVDLYFGMKNNSDVLRLQQFLTAQQVYTGPITGNFYALTKAAVIAYQRKNGVSATGYFGPKSRAVANAMSSQTNVPQGVPGIPPPPGAM